MSHWDEQNLREEFFLFVFKFPYVTNGKYAEFKFSFSLDCLKPVNGSLYDWYSTSARVNIQISEIDYLGPGRYEKVCVYLPVIKVFNLLETLRLSSASIYTVTSIAR